MKTKRLKNTQNEARQRNKYSLEQKEQARKYYLMGLNLHEISKLLDNCPVRTLEKWQLADKWTEYKQPGNIKIKCMELKDSGKTYAEISKMLKISPVTVWRYIIEARQF